MTVVRDFGGRLPQLDNLANGVSASARSRLDISSKETLGFVSMGRVSTYEVSLLASFDPCAAPRLQEFHASRRDAPVPSEGFRPATTFSSPSLSPNPV